MVETSASSYISQLRSQGMADEAIASRLAVAGWPQESIAQALKDTPMLAPLASPGRFRLSSRHLSLAAAGALAFVGIVALSISIYQSKNPAVYAINLPSGGATTTPLTYGSWPALADHDFYDSVKQQFVESGASFIDADLAAMKLTLYQEGNAVLEVPILAKGREGSWWETPVGLYAIQSREENHFSSFGEVYQPWSLGFQGNFFVHGWPYYPDGRQVESTYSGGCIRLSTEDARAVYEFSTTGMPILVYNTPEQQDSFQYRFKTPDISATSFAAADLSDGTVLAGQNISVQLPIASVTKLMTALVTVEYLNLERNVSVPRDALVGSAVPRLAAGGIYSVHDLLILLLTESSNEAAETLAHALGRSYFIELMNKKAASIGMPRTSFIDPSGLGTGNSSTAEDMFTFAKYLYENRRFILNVTNGTAENDIYGDTVFKGLRNFNEIPAIPNPFLGGKIGETNAARETYLGIFGLEVGGEERPIVVVVLGAADSQSSVSKLLTYLNEFYELEAQEE